MRIALAALFFLAVLGTSNGQTPKVKHPTAPPSGYRVTITDSKSEKSSPVHASKLAGGQFYLVASGGTIALPASTISAAEFELPTAVEAGLGSIPRG